MRNTLDKIFHNRRYNWIGLLVALAVVAFLLLYVLQAALSGNALFAFHRIDKKPTQAIIYYKGQTLVLTPGSNDYDRLINACYETIYNQIGIMELGWSPGRFNQARTEGIAVELVYAEPVKLPGRRIDIADPTKLFFPLEVFGAQGEVIFRGRDSGYWGLPIQVDTLDRVRTVVNSIMEKQAQQ